MSYQGDYLKIMNPQSELFKSIDKNDYAQWAQVTLYDAAEKTFPGMNSQSILVSEILEPSDVVLKMVDSGSNHIFQKNVKGFSEDLKKVCEFVSNPQVYFSNAGKNLLDNTKYSTEFAFSTTAEKSKLKEELMKFVEKIKSQNVHESAEAIIEELYMNAMLDAPREALRLNVPDNKYQTGEKAIMRMFMNDSELVISCEDPFGSLDIKKFVGRMHEVYKKGAGEVINLKGIGGAGLGCIIMFEHAKAIYLGVNKGKQSIVTCVVPLGMSYRQRAQVKKSIHLIGI